MQQYKKPVGGSSLRVLLLRGWLGISWLEGSDCFCITWVFLVWFGFPFRFFIPLLIKLYFIATHDFSLLCPSSSLPHPVWG